MAVYYVDGINGLDINSGDILNPFKTLEKALSVILTNGDVILLEPNCDYILTSNTITNLVNKSYTIKSNSFNTLARIDANNSTLKFNDNINYRYFEKLDIFNIGRWNTNYECYLQYTECKLTGNGTISYLWGNASLNYTRCLIDNFKQVVSSSCSISFGQIKTALIENTTIRNCAGLTYSPSKLITKRCIFYNVDVLKLETTADYIISENLQEEINNIIYGFNFNYILIKYLIKDKNNVLKTINNDIMMNSPLQTLDTNNFKINGFDNLSLLNNKLNDIDNPFKIYMYKE